MISCKEYAKQVKNRIREEIANSGYTPSLAIISVGSDSASESYVKGKLMDCQEVGITPVHVLLPDDILQEELNEVVKNRKETGVIVQLPLPKHLDIDEALYHLRSSRDVDGLKRDTFYTPCTALGIYNWLS